jgi:hypothetical protein
VFKGNFSGVFGTTRGLRPLFRLCGWKRLLQRYEMEDGDNKPEHGHSFSRAFRLEWFMAMFRNVLEHRPLSQARVQVDGIANDILDKVPDWLKSLWHMENELRNAVRNGLILRKDEASAHLAEARRHLEQAVNEAKGIERQTGRKHLCARKARSSLQPNLLATELERFPCLASSGSRSSA